MTATLFFVLPLQIATHSRTGSFDGNYSLLKNESGLFSSPQQNHLHQPPIYNHQHTLSTQKKNNPDGLPLSSADRSVSASLYNSLNTLLSQTHSKQPLYANNHSCSRPSADCLHTFSSRVPSQQLRCSNSRTYFCFQNMSLIYLLFFQIPELLTRFSPCSRFHPNGGNTNFRFLEVRDHRSRIQ